MSKKKPAHDLTPKKRRYIQERLKHPLKSKKDCAIAAGYSPNTAHNVAAKVERGCREKLMESMKRHGISDDYLIKRLKEGLNAKDTKYFAHEGRVRDKKTSIDHNARRSYLDMAFSLRGDFIDKKELEITGVGGLSESDVDALLNAIDDKPRHR